MTAAELATRLQATKSGNGWTAKCPAHDDARASLSIGAADDGRLLLHCFAGCTFDAIRAAAQLEPVTTERAIVAVYRYEDEGGAHLFDVVRFVPKDFRQRRADGKWKMAGVRRVLYRLPELQGKTVAYIVEGERDADRLLSLGLPGTTNAGGAGKWQADYVTQLKAATVEQVVILPDNDEPGRKHAEDVARSCHAAGLRVKVVPLPGVPDKGDVSDYLDVHTKADLAALVKSAPIYQPNTIAEPNTGLHLTTLGDFLAEPDDQRQDIVAGCLSSGSINLMSAKPKVGKSTAARHLALEVARGGRWLGRQCQQGTVWCLLLEGRRADIKAHFRQMGATAADPIRIFVGQAPATIVRQLRELAIHERPTLILVDTMQRLLKAKSMDDYAEITTALDEVIAIARDSDACLLFLYHNAKAERTGLDAVLGSTAISGSMDTIFLLNRNDRGRTISTVQRTGEDMEETVIALDEDGKVQLQGTRAERDIRDMEAALLKALTAEPVTQDEWLSEVEGRRQLKLQALKNLVNAGTSIQRTGNGAKGDPYRYRIVVPVPEVPPKGWEPENKVLDFSKNPNKSLTDSGSHVPAIQEHNDAVRF